MSSLTFGIHKGISILVISMFMVLGPPVQFIVNKLDYNFTDL